MPKEDYFFFSSSWSASTFVLDQRGRVGHAHLRRLRREGGSARPGCEFLSRQRASRAGAQIAGPRASSLHQLGLISFRVVTLTRPLHFLISVAPSLLSSFFLIYFLVIK